MWTASRTYGVIHSQKSSKLLLSKQETFLLHYQMHAWMHGKKIKHVQFLWISYNERQGCVPKHAHKPTEWTPLQNTKAILNRGAEQESNIYVDKWMEFFCCCFFLMELDRKPAECSTVVDSRVHALMRRLVVFLSNSKGTRGGSAMSCCCACYIKSVWPCDDSVEKNNWMGSSSAEKCLSCHFPPPCLSCTQITWGRDGEDESEVTGQVTSLCFLNLIPSSANTGWVGSHLNRCHFQLTWDFKKEDIKDWQPALNK